VKNLTWRPAGRREPVLDGFDLQVPAGQKLLLAGPSGSGKSTLLRAIAGLLLTAEVGDLSGSVAIDGRAPQERPGQVGLLLQDPSAAIVSDVVGRDVAFGLENTRVPREQMPGRVRRALGAAGFPYDEDRRTTSLSGGETQRLALAGALAMSPQVLLLDEPTAMLDQANAERVRRSVLDVCAETGTTLIVVEHRLGPWVSAMDRAVVLDANGSICADGPAAAVLTERSESLVAQGIWVPGVPAPKPVDVDYSLVHPHAAPVDGAALVTARDIEVRYRSAFARPRPGADPVALSGVSCELEPGRALVLRGPSGAGKSTLLAVLAGLQRPDVGSAEIHHALAGRQGRALWRLSSRELAARLSWVPQLAEHGLVRHTVLDELLLTGQALGRPAGAVEDRARALLEVLGLSSLAAASAHHLSGGEQRRLVVAAALVHGPAGVLLDEPTVGQDRLTWSAVTGLCRAAVTADTAIGVATHDRDTIELLGAAPSGAVLQLDSGLVARSPA
jgi:energy-coupling factor transport system ATP-binding protein